MTESLKKIIVMATVIGSAVMANGCGNGPRPRIGCLPTSSYCAKFLDHDNLGSHSYGYDKIFLEKAGQVYTCKAGHIDVTHLRWTADITRHAIETTAETLMKNSKGFSFEVPMGVSKHIVTFSYPEDWGTFTQERKEKIANDISLEAGAYLGFNATLWHEILTWYGVHFIGFKSEFNSAFSWEDLFSNLLGSRLAVKALQNKELSYDKAMTLAIDEELEKLGVQPRTVAIEAAEKMRGKWFTGNLVVNTKKRNFDIGLDGFVTPTVVPGVCEDKPVSYPVGNLEILEEYGFSMKYEIRPNVMEEDRIFASVDSERKIELICPQEHFGILMDCIKKQAAARGDEFDE